MSLYEAWDRIEKLHGLSEQLKQQFLADNQEMIAMHEQTLEKLRTQQAAIVQAFQGIAEDITEIVGRGAALNKDT